MPSWQERLSSIRITVKDGGNGEPSSKERLVVHLLNASGKTVKPGEIMKHGAPKVPFPPMDKPIAISVRKVNVKNVYAVSPDFKGRQPLSFQQEGENCRVVLPKELLKAYTLVFFE